MTLGITNSFLGTISAGAGGKVLLSASPAPSATVTTYSGYIVFKFTSSGTLNVGGGAPGTADVMIQAGGTSVSNPGGGSAGGAGGKKLVSPGVTITGGTPISVTVGGAGTNSTFGPLSSSAGVPGGSGGSLPGGSGGGGGAGPTNDYQTGSNVNYGGGGGGGGGDRCCGYIYFGGPGGAGGGGGGGRGSYLALTPGGLTTIPAVNGAGGSANTGGGAGGSGFYGSSTPATLGGSGVVIARFPDALYKV